ncbi:MAG: HAD family phosphatase [Clostridia bacterium]|nr:HAD family phosphatase [Clostridia bacterium]
MRRFDGILICSDLDGTLLREDKTISQENIDAIEFFKREGGLFTIVTGRMPQFVFQICEKIKPNAPFGCINGAALYDYLNHKYIWKDVLSSEFNELIRLVDEEYPEVGIQVNTFNNTYFYKDNISMQNFRLITNAPNLVCKYEEINEPIAKIVFGSESNEEIENVMNVFRAHKLAKKFDFVRSEKTLFEILPKDTGKGRTILKLCEYMNIDAQKTIALGDYDNDISMFNEAKIGIAVSNACRNALNSADYITVSNEENAIAKVINDLDKGKLNI